MAFTLVFSRKKTIRIVNSHSSILKKFKKTHDSVIYTPSLDNKFLVKVFFLDGRDIKFAIGHRGEK